ncbi:hypothetical protein BBP40_008752 [Aspergillus hancockii]|nr:hypothetical protein BBP40_008752 [Aspergillus hancockii]
MSETSRLPDASKRAHISELARNVEQCVTLSIQPLREISNTLEQLSLKSKDIHPVPGLVRLIENDITSIIEDFTSQNTIEQRRMTNARLDVVAKFAWDVSSILTGFTPKLYILSNQLFEEYKRDKGAAKELYLSSGSTEEAGRVMALLKEQLEKYHARMDELQTDRMP